MNRKLCLLIALLVPNAGRGEGIALATEDLFPGLMLVLIALIITCLFILGLALQFRNFVTIKSDRDVNLAIVRYMDKAVVKKLIELRTITKKAGKVPAALLITMLPSPLLAQSSEEQSLFSQWGIIITIVLIAIPLLFAIVFLMIRVKNILGVAKRKQREEEASLIADYLIKSQADELDKALNIREAELRYRAPSLLPQHIKLSDDHRGILHEVQGQSLLTLVEEKSKNNIRKELLPQGKLILWYLGCAAFWLVFGTTVGEYLGIKFVAPETDSVSWLSFGRLRPVHTNAVFWGWSSLAMLGLACYVVPKVSNTTLASIRKGWIALWLINSAVVLGTFCLMAGINNGGGEYREYIWPVMALFGGGLVISLVNFLQTIAKRKSSEIYISNWYIVSAIIFTLVIAFIAYWPTWQDGLGETIVQGYYMHQGVGMWFMLFNLGLVYYFLPQQVNKPIYSYGLGILAFWSQIVFYTLIGTHHFVFSAIPWWLQTVAIVGSAGMLIPVVAGTTNFYFTFKGAWYKMAKSYTLPFFFVGILFYFTGSLQGTAEAFRYTNLLWHFTDFTVAHSHLTMYGIIAFLLWGCIYVLVPRIMGREPSQLLTGIHFWLAFIGLMFYTIPLMIGGTLKGLMWIEGRFFIESITLMAPYWLWRAIGGSLMWLSHIVFAVNFYKMVAPSTVADVNELAVRKLKERFATANV
ncbi:MAG TPA: cbb3-type cytochrome c oxidase subunit I [Chryseosolibacter sp.]